MKPILLRQQGHSGGSGAVLARALGIPNAGPNSVRTGRLSRYIINYGVSSVPRWVGQLNYTNRPERIPNAVDKRQTLHLLEENHVPCLEFAASRQGLARVRDWLAADGKVVIRNVVGGHSAAGLAIHREGAIPQAPLYTRYFKKDAEYRVHIAFGNCILIQQKRLKDDADRNNPDVGLVRVNANGWVFSINNLDCDTRNYRTNLVNLATSAVQALELAHGAVDILVKHKRNGNHSMVVCEVNSAPALRNPSTLAAYVGAFRNELRRLGCEGFTR